MKSIIGNVLIGFVYCFGGMALEGLGFTSYPLYAFYGFCFGIVSALFNSYCYVDRVSKDIE